MTYRRGGGAPGAACSRARRGLQANALADETAQRWSSTAARCAAAAAPPRRRRACQARALCGVAHRTQPGASACGRCFCAGVDGWRGCLQVRDATRGAHIGHARIVQAAHTSMCSVSATGWPHSGHCGARSAAAQLATSSTARQRQHVATSRQMPCLGAVFASTWLQGQRRYQPTQRISAHPVAPPPHPGNGARRNQPYDRAAFARVRFRLVAEACARSAAGNCS